LTSQTIQFQTTDRKKHKKCFKNLKDGELKQMKEEIQKVRKVNLRSIMLIFLIIIGIGIIVLLQTKDSSFNLSGKSRFEKGAPAPNFTLPGLDGKMVSLTDYKGKVVLLNIWATWCPPCVEEMPSMEKLHIELKDEGFEILAVSIDESGAEAVLPFMKKHKLSFPALTDPKGAVKKLYRIIGVPESFIIDKDGIIVEEIIGPRDWATPGAIRYFRNLIQTN
jgi:peroxiredoxin